MKINKVVIWGLKNERHSHKYIQKGFYENFTRIGFSTIWLDDKIKSRDYVEENDLLICVDVASKYLPVKSNVNYVLHNISPEKIGISDRFIQIQVHSNGVTGNPVGIPWITWDKDARILYQPWGVAMEPIKWQLPHPNTLNNEYWVGSIWNNNFNQGNSELIYQYSTILEEYGIKFRQVGTTSRFQPNGVSEEKAIKLVNKSPIGAAVVGNWQKHNGYVPCRLFKNISSGAIPSSNAEFSLGLGKNGGIFEDNLEILIQKVLKMSYQEKREIVNLSQETILKYTYKENIHRILTFFDS